MPRRFLLVTALLATVLAASSAQAGYWDVLYVLDGTSTTNTPLGPDDDPIAGSMTIQYDAPSSGAALSGSARMMTASWNTWLGLSGLVSLTGFTNTDLLPGAGGTSGTLSVANLTLATVADSASTGYIHCYAGCGLAGMPVSSPQPQTPPPGTYPWFFNPFVFTGGAAGTGDWTGSSPPIVTVTSMGLTVTVTLDYVGREIDRRWCDSAADPNCAIEIPEPEKSVGLAAGLAGVVAMALLHRRRKR
jgi:hypothetical protein